MVKNNSDKWKTLIIYLYPEKDADILYLMKILADKGTTLQAHIRKVISLGKSGWDVKKYKLPEEYINYYRDSNIGKTKQVYVKVSKVLYAQVENCIEKIYLKNGVSISKSSLVKILIRNTIEYDGECRYQQDSDFEELCCTVMTSLQEPLTRTRYESSNEKSDIDSSKDNSQSEMPAEARIIKNNELNNEGNINLAAIAKDAIQGEIQINKNISQDTGSKRKIRTDLLKAVKYN